MSSGADARYVINAAARTILKGKSFISWDISNTYKHELVFKICILFVFIHI